MLEYFENEVTAAVFALCRMQTPPYYTDLLVIWNTPKFWPEYGLGMEKVPNLTSREIIFEVFQCV